MRGGVFRGHAQQIAAKTNLLYGAYAYAPNLSLEIGLGKRSTLDLGGGYNWFNRKGSASDNKKSIHWLGQIEYRQWFCKRFTGHFVGVHALGTQYNISGHKMPLLFGKDSNNYRYEGWGAGAGISYGYNFYLSTHWSFEATVGAGYVRLQYDKYPCARCGTRIKSEGRNYFGPTRAGISLIYIIK